MNRRSFLSTLAGALAATQYDPEKTLWVPGRKLFSIPKPSHKVISCKLVNIDGDGCYEYELKTDTMNVRYVWTPPEFPLDFRSWSAGRSRLPYNAGSVNLPPYLG